MRLLCALAAIALAAGNLTAQSWGVGGCQPAPAPVRSLAVPPCCVKVVVSGPGFVGSGSGTAVVVGDRSDCVLTCKHVVEGATAVAVESGGKSYPARVVRADTKADLALLRIDAQLCFAYVADAEPPAGTRLTTWGFGGGSFRPVGVTGTGSSSATAATAANISGDSGAGVFDDAGKLVGVHCAGDNVWVSLRVSLAEVKTFLAACACKPCDCGPCDCVEKLPPPREKVRHQFPPGGVSREDMTPAGKDKFCVNGVPCEDFEQFRAAMLGSGGALVDDSDWPYVYVIGPEADRDRVFKDFAEDHALLGLKVRLKGYPRDHPQVADYGPGLIHAQAANGRPLLALAEYEGPEKLAAQLKTAFDKYDPAKDPGPGRPYPTDEPKAPDEPAPTPVPQVPVWVYLVAVIALAYLLLSAKRS